MPPPPSGKRGLCWPADNSDATFPFTRPGSKVTWLYNWSPQRPSNLPSSSPSSPPSSIEFVPMQWNGVDIDRIASQLPDGPPPAAPVLLAFNEPERGDQANMTPEAAAEAWLAHIEPLRRGPAGSGGPGGGGGGRGLRAGSPGTASTEEGIAWLQRFHSLIRQGGSDVDFWALHWYGEGLGAFYDYVWSARHRLDPSKPVWITEFAATNWDRDRPLGPDAVRGFCRDACAYLDTLDWVERYAWFGPMRDTGTVGRWAALLDERGGISELGKVYRDS